MFHTIAYGASHPSENTLFTQVIAQSPGPQVSKGNNSAMVGEAFLRALNVSNVQQARNLPSEVLMAANRDVERGMPYFGPVVDGNLIPELPSRLYISGRHVKNLSVVAGHNANEARLFVPPTSDSQAAFDAFLAFQFPRATAAEIKYINQTLYPPPSSGTHGSYTTQNERLSLLDADVYNLCWTVLLAGTYTPRAWNYIFSVPPAYHAQDLAYTFYNGAPNQHDVNVTVAKTLQKYIVNFVVNGDPNGGHSMRIPNWGVSLTDVIGDGDDPALLSRARVLDLKSDGFSVDRENAVGRCGWWFETAFAGEN